MVRTSLASEGRRGAHRVPRAALVGVLLALWTSPGCARGLPNPFQRGPSDQVFLVVESRNWVDYAVYLSRGGARARLGTVTSHQTQTFRLPRDMTSPGVSVRFLADPVGSSRVYASPEVSLVGGETWVWTLMPQIEQSTLVSR
jgi:hypothetical protein